jgi:hypothetical protein
LYPKFSRDLLESGYCGAGVQAGSGTARCAYPTARQCLQIDFETRWKYDDFRFRVKRDLKGYLGKSQNYTTKS